MAPRNWLGLARSLPRASAALLDEAAMVVAPKWALERIRARGIAATLSRHFEAAQGGRRTVNWPRSQADANTANGAALATLRALARDLTRNNPWARRGVRVASNNTVGWGIVPKAVGGSSGAVRDLWKKWGETTECDADARLTFYGMQRAVLEGVAESGEVLIRRRRRRPEDGYAIPLQLQLLEPDFLDSSRDGTIGQEGGPIVQGVEFDAIGRRVAYWLFEQHPGAGRLGNVVSKRVSANSVLHVYRLERPGQVRGVSWFAPVIVRLRDFDEYEDATLMRQKIAACFAAFVSDVDGQGTGLGEATADPLVETLEPGLISYLPPGKSVSFAMPPSVADHDSYSATTLRSVAAGLGVTFEDMTGDYSRVNFSSARMARLAHWANVHDWRWNMLIPQFCDGAWAWAMEAAGIAGLAGAAPTAEWTPPPMPMIEPDKEGLAYSRLVRCGAMTHDSMVREQGFDPATHWAEYAKGLEKLDDLGIVLDSDARKVTQSGQDQGAAAAKGRPSGAAVAAVEEDEEAAA